MATEQDWRKNADTHKMSPQGVRDAGVEGSKRPPGTNPGGILHQRGKLPYSPITMTMLGLAIAGGVGYFVLYSKKKPEASAADVAKVATGVARPEDTHPRK
ncbi:hypothetical protein ACFE04_016966 [Oxalis oulophora]